MTAIFLGFTGIVPPVATVLEEPQECDPVVDDDDVFVDCPEAAREEDHLVLHGMHWECVIIAFLLIFGIKVNYFTITLLPNSYSLIRLF
jgi:hypothetical protein